MSEPNDATETAELTAFRRRAGWIVVSGFGLMLTYLVVSHAEPGAAIFGCPFRKMTGYSCFGCGMTRSTAHFIHGDPFAAFRFHPFGPAFVLGFAAAAAHSLVQNLKGETLDYAALRLWKRIRKPFWVVSAALLAVFGVVRFGLEVSGFLTPI